MTQFKGNGTLRVTTGNCPCVASCRMSWHMSCPFLTHGLPSLARGGAHQARVSLEDALRHAPFDGQGRAAPSRRVAQRATELHARGHPPGRLARRRQSHQLRVPLTHFLCKLTHN